MTDSVRVLILPNEDGEAAWLALATEHDDPDDPDTWQAEISSADWQQFNAAQKALGNAITAAVDASPCNEDGSWREPCPSFYSWKFDSPMAKDLMVAETNGEPSPTDPCSRCRHARSHHAPKPETEESTS